MRIITFLILLLLRTANGQSNSSSTDSVTSEVTITSSFSRPTVTQFVGMVVAANVVIGGSVWCATNGPACALGLSTVAGGYAKVHSYCRSSPEVEATCNVVRNTLRTTGNNLVFSRDNTDASEATWDNMDADGLLGVDYTIYPRNGRDM